MAKQPREVLKEQDQSYWAIVKRQFYANKLAVWSLRIVYSIIFVGMFADFIANDKPIVCKYNDKIYFPVILEYMVDAGVKKMPKDLVYVVDWKEEELNFVIWPLIPYGQGETDDYNAQFVGPFDEQRNIDSWRFWHFLGTESIGRDVMSGMIHGTRIAMLVGIISMGISFIIGIVIGSIAGFFGDNRLKVSRASIFLNLAFLPFAAFFASNLPTYLFSDAGFLLSMFTWIAAFLGVMAIPNLLSKLFKLIAFFGKRVAVPVDILISRMIEIVVSVPRLLLILTVVAIVERPSIFWVMLIIGATSWTGIARFIRGELLRVRSLEYIEAANALGYSEFRIIFKHALPNGLTSALIAVAFGVASSILIESSLSFLGIGVQAEVMTWGKLLNFAREDAGAWWLAVFPGVAIFITVTVFNLLGEGLQDAMDPKRKQ